ncbi:hypothetical protein BASA81_007425 [Batrachochytrium salamandrivorans]|nr:hypothetical protein BASA81_007425 [Batrachochytrium salamandrivorans]
MWRSRLWYSVSKAVRRRDSEFHHIAPFSGGTRNHDRLAQSLQLKQVQASQKTLPWFFANLPDWYFDSVPETLQQHHLSALSGIHESSMVPELALRFENTITLVHPQNEPGSLNALLDTLRRLKGKQVVDLGELESTQTFVAKDGSLTLNLFKFASVEKPVSSPLPPRAVPQELEQYVQKLQRGEFDGNEQHVPKHSPVVATLAKQVALHFPVNISPRRYLLQMHMVNEVAGSDGVATNVELDYAGIKGDTMITIAATEVAPIAVVSRIARFLGALEIDIARTSIDTINHVSVIKVLTTSFLHDNGTRLTNWENTGALHLQDLARVVKWIDDRVLGVFELEAFNHSLLFAECTVALSDLTHALLSPADPYQYARSRVLRMLTKQDAAEGEIGRELVVAFLNKFSPRFASTPTPPYDSAGMRAKINAKIENPSSRAVLEKLQDCVEGVVRTNLHLDKHRFALALRLDPTKCQPPIEMMHDREVPFGLFFSSGRRFTGFQLRFRDIARGGLRLVSPANQELFSMETSRQYFECFDLAFAQQLKNKDIAEGGAKAVCIVEAAGLSEADKHRAMRRTAKAFTDSVLDLLPPNSPDSNELVYFGPDENIVPQDIAWIANRAVERKYPLGGVVISSKAGEGINHKHYGVTSEGVNVFMETALLEQGIDPRKQPFTVKITGFGDVGGNLLKIFAPRVRRKLPSGGH